MLSRSSYEPEDWDHRQQRFHRHSHGTPVVSLTAKIYSPFQLTTHAFKAHPVKGNTPNLAQNAAYPLLHVTHLHLPSSLKGKQRVTADSALRLTDRRLQINTMSLQEFKPTWLRGYLYYFFLILRSSVFSRITVLNAREMDLRCEKQIRC